MSGEARETNRNSVAPSTGPLERLRARFADDLSFCDVFAGDVTLEIPAHKLLPVCRALRDEPAFGFGQLVDLCGVDYAEYGVADWRAETGAGSFSRGISPGAVTLGKRAGEARFAVVYHLLSHANNQRLRVRVYPPGEPPKIDSVVGLWQSADWFEREAFDLFGILFEGHPDLRRILTDYGFVGHPLRKDFPLSGHSEMRYDPKKQQVVYEPTAVEPRSPVPKVIRQKVDHEGISAVSTGDSSTDASS